MVVEIVWMAVDSVDCRRQCGLQETTWMVVDSVYRGRDSVDGGRDSVDGRRQRGLQETTWMAAETELPLGMSVFFSATVTHVLPRRGQ